MKLNKINERMICMFHLIVVWQVHSQYKCEKKMFYFCTIYFHIFFFLVDS